MYTLSTIQTALAGWIGIRDTKTTDIPAIDSSLTTAASGNYYDDFHPLLNTDTLYKCAPNFEAESYVPWSSATTYTTGQRVMYNGIAWQSKADANLNHTPVAGSWWKTVFSTWLGEKINSSIANLLNKLVTEKKLNLSTKALLENVQLFTGPGNYADTITNSGRMVGLQIDLKKINNIKVVLNYLGVQFSAIQTGFNIYLYHSSRKEAVASMSVTTTTAYKFEWKALTSGSFDLDFVNFANNIDSGGSWFIAYFEDDIAGSAINKKYDFEYGPCSGCSSAADDVRIYNLWNKYVDIQPFYFLSTNLDGANLPDLDNIKYTPTTNYGLNLSLSVVPALTEIISLNKQLLTYPLGLQFAYDMISWMLFNPTVRINPERINASQQVMMYERDGDANTEGLKQRLAKAITALAEDLSKLSTVLADNKPSPVRYKSM